MAIGDYGDGSTSTTAEAGKGYFINTTSATHTINLPASPSTGDTVAIKDYTGTFGTNNVTVGRNSSNMNGSTVDYTANTNHLSLTLVYTDSTEGWVAVADNTSEMSTTFISATGGTTSTSSDFKIHTFTSSGCFVVSCLSNVSASNEVSYLVVGGGGGGRNVAVAVPVVLEKIDATNDSYTVSL